MSDDTPSGASSATTIPDLHWQEYKWESTIHLPEWQDFGSGRGNWKADRAATYSRRRKREARADQIVERFPGDGDGIRLCVSPLDEKARTPPTPEQVSAYEYLLQNEALVLAAVLAAFWQRWVDVWLIYDHSDDDENRHSLPQHLRTPRELCGLIYLHTVTIHTDQTDGVAHIGLALSCDWDPEHGLGAYIHQSKVLGIGSGDLGWCGLDSAFDFDE